MTELQNRTLICSVLFIDIVEYSRKAVAEQIALKDRLNTLLSEALRGVALNDRIILDTGDGAAISFIGDPEDALFVATALRDAIQAQPNSPLATRMGINLGPVRLVKDINGRPNVIGDGINVAQRVMTFADPGQVLVSRSYYEVVSRLSEETSKLFSYEGARTDKHIREHEVYAVGAVQPPRRRTEPEADWRKQAEAPQPTVLSRAMGTLSGVASSIVRKPPLATGLAVAAILMVALGVRASREAPAAPDAEAPLAAAPIVPEKTTETPSQKAEPQRRAEAPPQKAEPQRRVEAPPQKAEPQRRAEAPPQKAEPQRAEAPPRNPEPQRQAEASQSAVRPAEKDRATKKIAPAVTEAAPTKTRETEAARRSSKAPREAAAEAAPEAKVAAAPAPATLSIAVAPWGEVHIDGKRQGVSPPLQEIQLAPGKHRIELRNTGAKPHVVNVDAKPGERIRIKHKFK
jgi:class 3 adenylate cyclase